jgi:hypothetical protein
MNGEELGSVELLSELDDRQPKTTWAKRLDHDGK